MDPATTPLGRMLLDEITPVVMVLRTPLVEESCAKSGLNFIEMLSPFCSFNNIDVPVRTANDQPYRLHKFKLRLSYASDVRQPNVEVTKERLKRVITYAGEKDSPDLFSDPEPIESVLTSSQPECMPTWFQYFNNELVRAVSFSDHEAFDHPVACLLIVSSKDEEPLTKFVDLFNTNQLPPLFNDGSMDTKILKHFLLLHDNQDGSSEKATKILTGMRSTFGLHECRLLCINSSQDGLLDHEENLWAPYKTDASPSQRIGRFLSIDDIDELRNIMQDLASKHIIPKMEQKIRLLNNQVSATRKGFRNQIKNLWWRKGKEDTPDSSNGPMYTFNSIESQIRVLGDFAFMLGDYELALSNYRLLSTDYKLDKAWKQYAGVQEMMGLTYFMLDQSRKDAEYCMENAFLTYLRIGSSGQRNATRCGLWWVEMLKTRDQYKDAATVYFRISGEEPLHSAVMLEQASYCYLLAKPPMLRKYGFHLILSGDLYKKCDQIKHAIRTYRGALSVFRGTKWSHIRDHVHFHIGKWYANIDMFDVAIKHMLEVLACGHQSKMTQEIFLRDFFEIVQKAGKTFEVLNLQLPVINIPSLNVVFEDHRTYSSPAAVTVKESLWQSLEEDMIPSVSAIRANWLDLQSKLLPKKAIESNICVAGEAITVDIEFMNPLQISLFISNISLICEYSASSVEAQNDAKSFTTENNNDEDFRNLISSMEHGSDMSLFTVTEVDISLGGGETVTVPLKVTPVVEGALQIVGVKWKLSGSVIGFHKFELDLVKRKVPKGRRKMKLSLSNNLKFLVIKSLPKLEGFIQQLPKAVSAGEMRHLTLELKNPSEIPVKVNLSDVPQGTSNIIIQSGDVFGQNMKMKISHPRFLNVGTLEVLNVEFPACLEQKSEKGGQGESKASDPLFIFPEDIIIHGKNPFLWPLWLRAAAPGKTPLYITIYYEMGDASSIMRYRTLRIHYVVEVLPALDVSFQISPCPSKLHEYLVQMDIVNKTRSECFKLRQLSALKNEWKISLFQSMDTIFPSESLMAGQGLSCFFKLKNGKNSVSVEESSSSLVTLEGSDVSLSCGSNEAMFDVNCSPLIDFHHYERLHQRAPEQGHQTVDFVLIYQSARNDNSSVPPPQTDSLSISSHHACYCSISSTSPICSLLDGPQIIHHNFSASLCEIKLRMTIHNSSDVSASVRVNTFDSTLVSGSLSTGSSALSGNEAGWHDVSVSNDIKITSSVANAGVRKSSPLECVSPFVWSGSSSSHVKIEPKSTTEIPLLICVFAPGTYDLSNYTLHWKLLAATDHKDTRSGICHGHPYYLTVLPQE